MRPIADNVGPQRLYIASRRLRSLRTRSDEGSASARLQHCERALRHITANRVKRGIALRRSLCEVLCVVVDDLIGTEATHIGLVGRACCADHMRTDMLGQLDGYAAHTPGAALNEDGLAGPELKGMLDGNQRGETRNGQSGSLDVAKTISALIAIFSAYAPS